MDAPDSPPPSAAPGQDLPPESLRRRIRPLPLALMVLAWCVVIGVVIVVLVLDRGAEAKLGEASKKDNVNLLAEQAQARYLLGILRELAEFSPGNEKQIISQIKALDTGPVDQRLRFAIMEGEMEGPDAALKALDELDQVVARNNAKLTPEQESQLAVLRRLYSDYRRLRFDGPSVSQQERLMLRGDLAWFGDLALAPEGQKGSREQVIAAAGLPAGAEVRSTCPDPAGREAVLRPPLRVLVVALIAFGTGVFFLLLGFCGLIALGVLLIMGKLRGGLECGRSPAGVYAETFALWMVLFIGLSLLVGQFNFGEFRWLASALVSFGTLIVLFWPVLRGVPWRQVREDIGWTLGRKPAVEPALGLGCYLVSYPLLLVGVIVMLCLMGLQNLLPGGPSPDELANPSNPSHPIIGPLARGDWSLRLQLLFLASVVAPIVEETMFRGVLYRHLRELTCRFQPALSVICCGLLSSFIFAVIHPQGILAVPVLMALACTFVLAREWRGTLIPSMIAHGLNNGFVLLVCVGMLGD